MKTRLSRPAQLFLTSTVLYGFAYMFWELFFNLYMLSRGIPKETLGLIRAVTPLVALLFGIPIGKLADRIGSRISLIIGLSINLISMVLMITLSSPWLILLMGMLQGIGLMFDRVAIPPFIMQSSTEENRTVLFSLYYGLQTFAFMFGSLVAGQMPSLAARILGVSDVGAASYQMVILAGIIFGITCLIPLFLIREKNLKTNSQVISSVPKFSIKQMLSQKIIKQLFARELLVGLGAALLIPYLNVFFRETHQMDDRALGLLFSISSLFIAIGSLGAPWLARKMRTKTLATIITQAVSIVFLLMIGFAPSTGLSQVSYLFRGVFMQIASPLLDNFAMEVSPPGQQGTVAGIRSMGWQVGQTVGLYASGLVQARFGFDPLFVITAALYLANIFMVYYYFRPVEKKYAYAVK